MTEYQFVRLAIFVGGPYDGMNISGNSIPDAIKVQESRFSIMIGTPEERNFRQAANEVEKRGMYYAQDEMVSIDNLRVDFCSLLDSIDGHLEFPDDVAEQCAWMPGTEDGERIILIYVDYLWKPLADD